MTDRQLKNTCEKTLAYCISKENFNKSELWESILKQRKNYPIDEEFKTFIEDGFNNGTGNQDRTHEEEIYFSDRIKSLVYAYDVPDEFIQKINEPDFGKPLFTITVNNKKFSSNYFRNIINAYNIYNNYKNKSDLVITEIGGGSGILANILFQVLDISKYILIDLPENLYLSSVYLSYTTSHDISYIKQTNLSLNTIISCLPNNIYNINLKNDIVINTNSFGEIPIGIVQEYIKFSYDNLKDDGILYSHNRLSASNNCPTKLTDYFCDGFNIFKINSSPCNTFFNYDLHHVMFLNKNKKKINSDMIDMIGYFIKSGIKINDNLDIYENIEFITLFKKFFKEQSLKQKEILLKNIEFNNNTLSNILLHYKILISFVNGNNNHPYITEYLKIDHFKVDYSNILILIIACKNKYIDEKYLLNKIKESDIKHFKNDVLMMLNNKNLSKEKISLKLFIKNIIFFLSKDKQYKLFIKNKFLIV